MAPLRARHVTDPQSRTDTKGERKDICSLLLEKGTVRGTGIRSFALRTGVVVERQVPRPEHLIRRHKAAVKPRRRVRTLRGIQRQDVQVLIPHELNQRR